VLNSAGPHTVVLTQIVVSTRSVILKDTYSAQWPQGIFPDIAARGEAAGGQ
jgi:hypothetical protein